MSHRSGSHADVVVVGAGVVGAATAQHLARRGLSVVVVDRAPGIGGGCSYANAALLAPHHVTPLATPALLREAPAQMVRQPPAVRVAPSPRLAPWLGALAMSAVTRGGNGVGTQLRELAVESTRLHRRLAAEGHSPSLRKTGALDVYLRAGRRDRHPLSAEQLREREPALGPAVVGGSHDSEEWTVESRSFVAAMLDDAREHGARVEFGAVVDQLTVDGGRVTGVQLADGAISAEHVVLAAGMGSVPLAARAGVSIPLRGGRGYVIDLARQEGGPTMPVRVKENRVVVTPLADRTRVSGAIEFGSEGAPLDARRPDGLRGVAAQALPVLREAEVIDRWAGERPCTPDGVPVIGPSGSVANLVVATGHGMWGLILAPVTARLVGQAITDPAASVPAWLSPDRFAGALREVLARMTALDAQTYAVPSVRLPNAAGPHPGDDL